MICVQIQYVQLSLCYIPWCRAVQYNVVRTVHKDAR
jgi:hypothetical protein